MRSSSPGWRPVRGDHSFVSTAMTRPCRRTGTARRRVVSGMPSTTISPSTISPDPCAFESSVASDSLAHEPTQSER